MLSKIKEEFKSTFVAFGKGGSTLGNRKDLDDLALLAQESGDKRLKSMFEVLPSAEELKKAKVNAELRKIPSIPVKVVSSKKDQIEG